jgi:translation initiation factor 2 subunit 1
LLSSVLHIYKSQQAALTAGKKAEVSEDQPITIKLIAPPLYVLSCTMFDREAGVQVLTEAIDLITTEIKRLGGECKVDQEPHATTMEEESKLMATYTELQRQSEMVDGDD